VTIHAEVIGDPIAQSKSPIIHGFWLEKLGLAGDYRKRHVVTDGLAAYFADRRADPDWRGCNVTIPHKQAVWAFADRIEPAAARIGAVNTIARDGDALVGFNTDYEGFLEPIRTELDRPHFFRMARVIGTGGAARAVIAALADQGFVLVVAGRDTGKARALLDELAPGGEHHVAPLDHFADATDFAFDDRAGCLDLIVNTTSLGMAGQPPLAFDLSHAPPGSIVYDIVTTPAETPLLVTARANGFRTVDGLAMLIGQAATAFHLFFGADAPRQFDAELRARLAVA
jgi:shikimate dehydrogenase